MEPSAKGTSKIWITFFIILIMVGLAIVWSFRSYQKLNNSIETLTQPDPKSALIQKTIQGISKAENYIQSYILTNNITIYRDYQSETKNVLNNITLLGEQMAEDSLQVQRVDTLERLFLQKLSYLDDFLKEKKAAQYRVFSSQALEKIKENTQDSTSTETQILTKVKTTEKTQPTLTKDVIETEFKAPGLWEGIKRLFGAKDIRVDTVTRIENDTVSTTEIVIDTLQIVDYNPDTVLLKVKKILQEVVNQEYSKRVLLSSKELSLLEQDLKLSEEIDRIISQLQVHEISSGAKKRAESFEVTRGSSRIVLAFGVAGIGLGGIFLFAIGRDLIRSRYLSKRLEEEKNKANDLAKMKEEFLANMSHEIRTPLNSILGFSNLIRSTPLNSEQKNYTTGLDENTRYLAGLINDILDFSKLESSRVELSSSPFHVPHLAEYLHSTFAIQCEQKGLEFHINYNEQLNDIDLIGDEFRLKQILGNLLGNAVKFTASGSVKIDISNKEKSGKQLLTIRVRDTGKGIAPSKFKNIFNAFEQEDSSVTKEFGGTGLGLAIVKKLMDAMGGKITVDSSLGEYTEFKLKLSFGYQKHTDSAKNSMENINSVFYEAHVVIIEDDYWNRTLLKALISKQVSHVSLFEHSKNALEFILKNKRQVDLILTDISMPELSGVDLLRRLRFKEISTPIVAITAHAMPQKIKEFNKIGFNQVITKPFNDHMVDIVLKEFLSEKKLETMTSGMNELEFNFEKVKQFSGDDHELLSDLIRGLIDNNSDNLSLFEKHLQQENRTLLADLAHKMVQTYDSLDMPMIVESLKSIETYNELDKPEHMFKTAKELLPDLQAIHLKLKRIKP